MDNKEIIIEELQGIGVSDMIGGEGLDDFASSLLKKLNKLNKENVEKILKKSYKNHYDRYENIFYVDEAMSEVIDQILQLIPEEGEVVAEGIVMSYPSGFEIGDKTLSEVNRELYKYKNKTIEIIIREVK